MSTIGFIIIRHVNNELTNMYWNECYRCIRLHYPDFPITIIDDNSNQDLVISEQELINVNVINSEFPKSGEVLPYYYMIKLHLYDYAIILHDSVFIKSKIPLIRIKPDILFLWHFEHSWCVDDEVMEIIENSNLNRKNEIIDLYFRKNEWFGCFGVQSFVSLEFLNLLEEKYNITDLVNVINTRPKRCCAERIFAVLCYLESKYLRNRCSIYGVIHFTQNWGSTYDQYLSSNRQDIVKVWTGR